MSNYAAPLDDYNFLLNSVLDYSGQVQALPGYEDFTPELIEAIKRVGTWCHHLDSTSIIKASATAE